MAKDLIATGTGATVDMIRQANMLALSEMVPACYQREPANIYAAIQLGKELGISPMAMLTNSFPVNNKITMMADLMIGLCKKHPDYVGMTIQANDKAATVTMKRRLSNGEFDEATSTFTEADAKRAGLYSKKGPWTEYPARMYKHRAAVFCARDLFPDVLAGVYTYEEMQGEDFVPSADPENGEDSQGSVIADAPQAVVASDPKWEYILQMCEQAQWDKKSMKDLEKRYDAISAVPAACKKFVARITEELEAELQALVLQDEPKVFIPTDADLD